MGRKPDMNNIRERSAIRNGRRQIRYQVRVRLQDDRGVNRTFTQTFDAHEAAIRWRDDKRSQVQQGELGDKLERRKALHGMTLGDLLRKYRTTSIFQAKRSSANEFIMLMRFLEAEATGLCKISRC